MHLSVHRANILSIIDQIGPLVGGQRNHPAAVGSLNKRGVGVPTYFLHCRRFPDLFENNCLQLKSLI